METTKNNVNTFFQNPEVSAEDQLAPLPMEITLTTTETPQISTETAETVNVSAEGEKAEKTLEMQSERKITYFHHTPERLRRYIIDVYEKRANGEWVLLPYEQIDTDAGLWDVVDGKIGWWTNWRREKFSEMNMDFNSPTCGRCCKINRTYQTENYVVSNEKLLEFSLNGNYYYIQKQIYNDKEGRKEFYTIMDACGEFRVNDASDTLEGIMQRFDKCYKRTATIIWQAPTEPPQSPETPQTVECADECDCRVCSHCGARFHEGYFLGNEYACSDECAVALYGGDREQFEADLEAEEEEAGTTECYWSIW